MPFSNLPKRRRTVFGQVSNLKLEIMVGTMEAMGTSDHIIKYSLQNKLDISPETFIQNAKDREIRMAANAVLKRRRAAEEEGKTKDQRWRRK